MASSVLPSWPPDISSEQLNSLTLLARTYALSHGLLYLPIHDSPPSSPISAIHAPFTLFPSPIPRHIFEKVQRLQSVYDVLYARVAMDEPFLDKVMGEVEGVGQVDEFVGALWRGWKTLRDQGRIAQPLQLGLFRSDYLMHDVPDSGAFGIKQVEFNTISSSFGPLSQAVSKLHRHLQQSTGYYNASPLLSPANLPPNDTTAGLVTGIASAHKAYDVNNAYVLLVVQPGERNIFDQRWLEYELLERYGIRTIRQTFSELIISASIHSTTQALLISTPLHPTPVEISTIYFRAGYTPTDYPSAETYSTRLLLESSRAIKCPSIALQLAGGKKIQQVLSNAGVLESFLCDTSKWPGEVYSASVLEDLRSTWVEMWGLDELPSSSASGKSGVDRALAQSSGLVLKPQREGGGNNVYKSSIPPFLSTLDEKERQAWIAMELIRVPEGGENWLVRAPPGGAPVANVTGGAEKKEVVSELGIFGWALFGEVSKGEKRVVEESGAIGWLVRTKGKESDEGGVAVGYSVLDSLVLV